MAKKVPDDDALSKDMHKMSLKDDTKGKGIKKEAIEKGAATKSKEITVVTWNINHGSYDKDKGTSGYGDVRRELVKYFTDRNPGYLYCIQEAKDIFDKANFCYLTQKSNPRGDKDGAVVFQKEMKHTPPPLKDAKSKCHYDDDIRRFYGAHFTIKDGDITHSFTLISYHGYHSGKNNENKKAEIKKFFIQMLEVAEIHKMTIIIGGDFNLAVEEWRGDAEKLGAGRIKVADEYKPGELRKIHGKSAVIDTFAVVYPPEGIPHTHCVMNTPVPVSQDEAVKHIKVEKLTPERKEELYKIMDHDVVTVNIKLITAKQKPKDTK